MSEIQIGDFITRNYRGHTEVMTVEGRKSIATFWGHIGEGFVTEDEYQDFIQLFASAPDLQRELELTRKRLGEAIEILCTLEGEWFRSMDPDIEKAANNAQDFLESIEEPTP